MIVILSKKKIICIANCLEKTKKKSLKLFRSESGASEIIMYIMYLVMSCKYVHMYVNNHMSPELSIIKIIKNFKKLSIILKSYQ